MEDKILALQNAQEELQDIVDSLWFDNSLENVFVCIEKYNKTLYEAERCLLDALFIEIKTVVSVDDFINDIENKIVDLQYKIKDLQLEVVDC